MDSSVSPKDEIWFLRVCHRFQLAPTAIWDGTNCRTFCDCRRWIRGVWYRSWPCWCCYCCPSSMARTAPSITTAASPSTSGPYRWRHWSASHCTASARWTWGMLCEWGVGVTATPLCLANSTVLHLFSCRAKQMHSAYCNFYVYGPVHRWSTSIIVQRDATQSSLFIILQVYSTCSGCQPHLSSGVHKTVTTVSVTGHIFCAAIGGCGYSFVYSWWRVWLTPETSTVN